MIRKILTFAGAFSAILLWGKLISLLDVSAPPAPESYLFHVAFATIVAMVFVSAEFVLKRPHRDSLLKILLDVSLVCLVASAGFFVVMYMILVAGGYATSRYVGRDLFSAVLLGVPLFLSTFVFISVLRGIAWLLNDSAYENGDPKEQ